MTQSLPIDSYLAHDKAVSTLNIAEQPLQEIINGMKEVYLADTRPWIIGFSGGKDSTVVLSLVFTMLNQLTTDQRRKQVYVVSSDTLVETPVVVDLIKKVLRNVNESARYGNLPVSAHAVHPKMDQTFWVNLLGRGYPAPKQSFRWCTERMKIDPVSDFITDKVAKFGEVIVVLGSRRQESASRAQVIAKHRIRNSALSRHTTLPNAYTFMPIENWSADEVWEYLMAGPCPWGGDNAELFELYKGSNQGECPLVIDTSTPSCGNSRFGCWTCTVVSEDRALHGLIETGNAWMQPLLDFRNKLYDSIDPKNASAYRHVKRRTNRVTYRHTRGNEKDDIKVRHIPGPYKMEHRQRWLKDLLEIQKQLEVSGHSFELIRKEELQSIRQQWLRDPIEPDVVDSLPQIYREVFGERIEWVDNDAGVFSTPDALLLRDLGERYGVPAELVTKLLEVELSKSGLGKRIGIMRELEMVLRQDWDIDEALEYRELEFETNSAWREKIRTLQEAYDKAPTV
ncbi:sulfurtransferase DndC [Candidatus Thiodiazotropha endoloripes]|uniref:DNA phosphorothioation system sulfurtransferase DndC n=1 Tax=Candidatus Thiodiazotropha endoloripes TaxID=1818881 RepID=UPI00083D5D7C|nr:DNA phosphorothioation system sulfurtransferase DndC [Candidatus Thiodiazotropha endoloripes]ODB88002.1 sulfurtransferase DndC [Candidatus Thiodiazotropha endoloripes]